MELEVKNIIFRTIRELILASCVPGKWISVSTEIYDNLGKLNPTICEDGDTGKIAFGAEDHRMKIRTARFLTRKLHLNSGFLNDVQIRVIQTEIDEILFSDMIQTYISTGLDITKNYSDGIGGSSCMTGYAACRTRLYQDNPDVYSQLIMKRGNDSARAMIVKLDNGKYILDRIYTDADDLIEKMKDYAKDQGWISGYYTHPGLSGEEESELIVTGLSYTNGEVPYQDSLTYGRIQDGLLDLMYSSVHEYHFEVDDTDGYIGGSTYNCVRCEEGVSEEGYYMYGSEIYCEYCFDQVAFTCGYCSEATAQEDRQHISDEGIDVCPDCADNHYAYCNECEEYFSTDQVQYVESEQRDVCDDCLDRHYRECTDCNEFFSGLIELENGDEVCEGCREIELQKDIADCIGQLLLPFKDQKCLPSGFQKTLPLEYCLSA